MRLTIKTKTRRSRPAKWALALLTFIGAGSTALAAPIEVNNSSFERAALDAGGWNNALPDTNTPISGADWTGPNGPEDGSAFIEFIDGFSAEGSQHLGMQNGYFVYQITEEAWAPNTNYTLVSGVGNRSEGFSPAGALAVLALTTDEKKKK